MAFDQIFLYEKYSQKLLKETMLSFGITNGGLALTTDGIVFDPNNTALAQLANRGPKSKPRPLDYHMQTNSVLLVGFNEISRVEIGSFQNLWKTLYTLRLYTQSGEIQYYLMPKKETAENWVNAINARL